MHAHAPLDSMPDELVGAGLESSLIVLLQELQKPYHGPQGFLQVMGGHVRELLEVRIGARQLLGILLELGLGMLALHDIHMQLFRHGVQRPRQVREFIMSDRGIELKDVYIGPSGMLTGSARVSQQARERAEQLSRNAEIERQQLDLKRKHDLVDGHTDKHTGPQQRPERPQEYAQQDMHPCGDSAVANYRQLVGVSNQHVGAQ